MQMTLGLLATELYVSSALILLSRPRDTASPLSLPSCLNASTICPPELYVSRALVLLYICVLIQRYMRQRHRANSRIN